MRISIHRRRMQGRFFAFMLAFALPFGLRAATLSYQTSAPTPGASDVFSFTGAVRDYDNVGGNGSSDGSTNDASTYVGGDRPQQGQTFTTGANAGGYQVKAIWLRHVGYTGNTANTSWLTANGAGLTVRVTNPAAASTSSFALTTETVTTTGSESGTTNSLAPVTAATSSTNGTGVWVRFAFSIPVTLQPNKQYGFDVTSGSTTFYFETLGIRNAAAGGNPYAGGSAYSGSTNGATDNAMNTLSGDRVFLVELAPVVSPLATPTLAAEPFSLDRVRLLAGRFKSNQDLDRTGYLSSLTVDQLLYPFRNNAGLTQPAGASSLGNWDSTTGFVRGHMAGHWLSAAAAMYAATGDASFLPKIQSVVTELKKCQDALATKTDAAGRSLSGYLSAFPISFFERLETTPEGASVPFYTIHKIMAGLVDAYRYAGVTQALDMAIDMSDYHARRMTWLTATQIDAMLKTNVGGPEWGGMNEVLTDIYQLSRARGDSNPERHLTLAKIFHRDWFITPLFNNQDQLNGLHANTHVPQVTGFAHVASFLDSTDSERTRLYTAADNFWHIVTGSHWLVLGGNSYYERFSPAGRETGAGGSSLNVATAETCNTYNMLKLSKELFARNPLPEYADYYEHALYNHILASMAPDTGMFTYFVPMISGHFKTYSRPVGSSWCCQGTGIENPALYGQAIYFHKDDALWVNLYIPSTLNWSEKGMTLQLDTTMPQSGLATLTVHCSQPTAAKIRLRIPGWIASAPTITVNGSTQNVTANASSYVELSRTWSDGDVIGLTLPMGMRLDRSMDDSTQVSLFLGPILLAADLGTSGMPASDQAANQLDYQNVTRVSAPLMISPDAANLSSWVQAGADPLTLTASTTTPGVADRYATTLKPFYDIHHTRYAVYWRLIAPTGWRTWSGGGAQTTWTTAGNWDAAPSAKYALRFGTAAGGSPSNNFAASTVFNGLEFSLGAGAFVLGGNKIGLQGDIRNASSVSQRIDLPLELQDGVPWFFDAAGGDLTLSGAITGSGILNKRGAYTLTLLSDSAFTGSIKVAQGELQVGNGGAAGSVAGAIPITLAGGGTVSFNRSDTFNVSSAISGAGTLVKRGTGTMNLVSSATQSGPVTVEGGKLSIASQQVPVLAHRWSFNGNLTDSVGSSNATVVDVGANNTTLSASGITLTGGARTASDYVSLGSGLLPKDGTPVTIELWATQVAFQSWARIFDVGASNAENLFMAWGQTTVSTDRVEWKDGTTSTKDNTIAPYTAGTKYHIAMVIEPGAGAAGATRVTWYAAPASAGSLGAAKGTFDTSNTLGSFTDTNFWLGRSEYTSDAVANASYDEVRLWNRSFTASELNALHTLGPDSVGSYATQTRTGSLTGVTDLSVGAGGQFDAAGNTQEVTSVAGGAGAVVNLNGGQLRIKPGGSPTATFAGNFTGTGTIVNDGTLRLVGNATLPAGITLTNNGTLDVMTWQGTLPAGVVNNGVVLDRSAIAIKQFVVQGPDVKVSIRGYSGHTYQLQARDSLDAGSWSNVSPPVSGADADIDFTRAGDVGNAKRFYRIAVDP
jgi:autotransporter-associated beta strand protein